MKIHALSFDFDGCLFHEEYIRKSFPKSVVLDNQDFLKKIKEENTHFDSLVVFIGSNRQSWQTDQENMFGKGSCFPAIKEISDELQARLDSFLLADIYGDLEAGESYTRALDEFWDEDNHSRWIFDDSKVTILYAQMQKIAYEYPRDTIVFEFYDDRGFGHRNSDGTPDLLELLNEFFVKYPEMIPNNIILRLNHYAGGAVTPIPEIQGTGMIDANFRETVKNMAKEAQHEGSQHINAIRDVNPTLLRRCRIVTVMPNDSSSGIEESQTPLPNPPPMIVKEEHLSPAEEKFRAKLITIQNQETELRIKAIKLVSLGKIHQSERYIAVADCAHGLVAALDKHTHRFFSGVLSKNEFRKIYKKALKRARPTLEGHERGEQIACNIALAFAGLGIFYIAASLIHKVVTGKFLFFESKLTESLDELDKVCKTTCSNTGTAPQP